MITVKSIGNVSMRESDDDNMYMDKYQNGFIGGCNTIQYDCQKHWCWTDESVTLNCATKAAGEDATSRERNANDSFLWDEYTLKDQRLYNKNQLLDDTKSRSKVHYISIMDKFYKTNNSF